VLDVLLHDRQDLIAGHLSELGADVIRADIRDAEALRRAVSGVDAVVHLAAIVGDPACARDPDSSRAVNVAGSRAVIAAAREASVRRLVFASTCSNYGRMADGAEPVNEDGVLAPVSLYAEQKVEVERELLGTAPAHPAATCLRFATVYGAAPRMRFDLTVNEFTRDLWAGRELVVFGEQFWRPYVHVRDAARAIRLVLEAPLGVVAGEVFNVGHSAENYRKLDLVELVTQRVGRGTVRRVHRDEDPRDYRVAFDKIHRQLGFEPRMRVADGIDEVLGLLESGALEDPFAPRYSNS
jgi:nucleoside-diphosphate-sugar epimerase